MAMPEDETLRPSTRGNVTYRRPVPSFEAEAVYQRYLDFGLLVSGGRVTPNWLPDGAGFWYAEGSPNERRILKFDAATQTVSALFDVPRLRSLLQEQLGHEPAGTGVPFGTFVFVSPDRVSFTVE